MKPAQDWASRPLSSLLTWVAPIAIATLTDWLTRGWRISTLAWVLAFAWMGISCVLNARRCHRRHCYLSGPIFLIGAAVLGLQAIGVMSPGINAVVWSTFALVLLSFVPELIWGKYVRVRAAGE